VVTAVQGHTLPGDRKALKAALVAEPERRIVADAAAAEAKKSDDEALETRRACGCYHLANLCRT
jgi:hypothetical protein